MEEVLNQIELLSDRVIIWIQDLSLKRFENKEDGNYPNLIYLYNKIDAMKRNDRDRKTNKNIRTKRYFSRR